MNGFTVNTVLQATCVNIFITIILSLLPWVVVQNLHLDLYRISFAEHREMLPCNANGKSHSGDLHREPSFPLRGKLSRKYQTPSKNIVSQSVKLKIHKWRSMLNSCWSDQICIIWMSNCNTGRHNIERLNARFSFPFLIFLSENLKTLFLRKTLCFYESCKSNIIIDIKPMWFFEFSL